MQTPTPVTFKDILIRSDELARTWPSEMTIMMRMTSKSIREAVDEVRLPTTIHLNWQIYINNIFHFYCIHKLLFYY